MPDRGAQSSQSGPMGEHWLDPEPGRELRILFVMLHPGYVRNYESTLRLLLDRGHTVQLAFAVPKKQAVDSLAERLSDEYPRLTFTSAAKPKRNGWRNLTRTVDLLADISRYMHPRYRSAHKLRERVLNKARENGKDGGLPLLAFRWVYGALLVRISNARISDVLVRFWLWVAELIPTPVQFKRFIQEFGPDLVLSTPLVTVGSFEPGYMRAARRLGVQTGLCVASWDNLSNKGVIKGRPHRAFVWNEIQRNEAVEMHNTRREDVVVTGAQRFDGWFVQEPTWSRETFCHMAGLDQDRPFLLYLCSSPFIAPDEVSFVRRFLRSLRTEAPAPLRDVGVLIRPHPQNADQWANVDLEKFGSVSIWPRAGAQPVTDQSRAVFFDSMYHATTVVGVNTSAQIEAGIVGRSVHTLLSPEFKDTQEGTLHFHYLLYENGGLLHVSATMGELLQRLEDSVTGVTDDSEQLRSFIESFIRPLGRDVPGTLVLAGEIERLGQLPAPEPHGRTLTELLAWPALRLLAFLGAPVIANLRSLRVNRLRRVRTLVDRWRSRKAAETPIGKDVEKRKREALQVHRTFKTLARKAQGPVIAGPWLADMRLELLYWIPALRRFTQRYGVSPSQIVAVSGTGTASWYRGVTGGFIDLRDVVREEDLIVLLDAEAHGRFDGQAKELRREVLAAVKAEVGTTAVLEPSVLRSVLRRYRSGGATISSVTKQIDLRGLRPPPDSGLREHLPPGYVTAHFAFHDWFPDTPVNRELVEAAVASLAERSPVVLLDSANGGAGTVQASEFDGGNVVSLAEEFKDRPQRSLELQSECIAASSGFVGTYSGFAHLAQAYGRGAIALFSDSERLPMADLDLSYRQFLGRPGWILPVDARRLDLIRALQPDLVS